MKKIVIIYATNSGGTEEACESVREVLASAGHIVTMQRASVTDPQDFDHADLCLLASPTWESVTPDNKHLEGQLQGEWRGLAERLGGKRLDGGAFAVLGFGDSHFTNFAAAADHLVSLVRERGGTLVDEPLRVDRYFFHLDENRKRVRQWAERLRTSAVLSRE